jgi:integrase
MRAWLFQDHRARQRLGVKAKWSVGWIDPDGRRRSKQIGSKSMAEKFRRKIEGELAAGTYQHVNEKGWADFRAEYEAKILPRLAPSTQRVIRTALDHFQRLCRPRKISAIKTATVDDYIARRQLEPGQKRGATVAPVTINKELRHIKAAMNVARDWEYTKKVPKFRRLKEPEEIGRVVTQDHFQSIYQACDCARVPKGLPCTPAEWWRALLVFAITTGWRIDEILSFRRDDLDLETGTFTIRGRDTKGKRADIDHLPLVTLDHVKRVVGFSPLVFEWPSPESALYQAFHRIQMAAGIHLPCSNPEDHECSTACHLYGFHALRRAYATLNADKMPAVVLQKKMRHKSFNTTKRYIELADKMKKATEQVYIPEFLKSRKSG